MLILIAESKTMAACDSAIGHDEYLAHRPALEAEADAIMGSLRRMNADMLHAKVKISLPMVRRLQQMIYEFPNKAVGGEAMGAFTGVVFKAFKYNSLDDAARAATCDRVRIISSLYGWLRPDDIIKQYRFDFTTPLAPDGRTFMAYWRDKVTDLLLKELHEKSCTDILDLMPGDAARCIDWKRIAPEAKVWRADFREIQPGGAVRTPNSNRLKTLRGELLRQIIVENIDSPAVLSDLCGDNYAAAGPADSNGNIVFHTAD